MAEQPDPAQLAEAIKGLSDEDLNQQIKQQGYDATLQQIFHGMKEAFRPDKAGGVNAQVQYDINTDDGVKSWTVTMENGTCTTSEGAAPNPRVILKINIADFVRLIFGQADGMQLFMTGKLKLEKDMMFASQLQNFFERRF